MPRKLGRSSTRRMPRKLGRSTRRISIRRSRSRRTSKTRSRGPKPHSLVPSVLRPYIYRAYNADDRCPICLGDLSEDPTVTTECLHQFHRDCLATWADAGHTFCPVCHTDTLGPGVISRARQRVAEGVRNVAGQAPCHYYIRKLNALAEKLGKDGPPPHEFYLSVVKDVLPIVQSAAYWCLPGSEPKESAYDSYLISRLFIDYREALTGDWGGPMSDLNRASARASAGEFGEFNREIDLQNASLSMKLVALKRLHAGPVDQLLDAENGWESLDDAKGKVRTHPGYFLISGFKTTPHFGYPKMTHDNLRQRISNLELSLVSQYGDTAVWGFAADFAIKQLARVISENRLMDMDNIEDTRVAETLASFPPATEPSLMDYYS